ncbi:ATP-dependent zinc metalloprotease FtsH [Corynebacterium guangdongense]|uniref:ATP-dependent zinc metalloprotease FtsH n=1 Tax=Corynebacterium guangdongense TaxID=1783348 RepID=A0ABU1ZZP4_9CORY|nr:ATP-dependent zinc metalloprotease FtsH [Corynebacterium guangdongense]MDR7330310.1 cell division protease FtsH [Corynebacterium guangdongense]WJZ18868.1 ATP-dependent zinc metalloprotease FtsH [Corynebacterium guangdongense]
MKNKRILQIGLGTAAILVLLFVFSALTDETRSFLRVDTSVAMEQLSDGNVAEAQIDDREQRVRLVLREPITVDEREGVEQVMAQYPARATPQVFDAVAGSGADDYTTNVTQDSVLMGMLTFLLPMLILFGLLFFFMTRMQSGGMFGFGGNKAKELTKDMPTNTFADVAGADDAVDELQEVVDFLTDPSPYEELGAKIPRGVLLYGPPGTGKTLIARAVAGEAGVPFYSISGSDFVEMFVGVGASRVRDLFKQAKENSPCIIFIDEIDAVGRQRGSGTGGGHDEREQTLNQLLVEMDGFGDREGVIIMAATNRPDILDPALLRPGRFDRQIPLGNPDLAGREKILAVHAEGKPLAPDANLRSLAKRTAGMSGADLANVLNEAALLTARIGGNVITADALEEATDRVIGGPRRSSTVISEEEKKITAYHEGGHTLSAWALEDIDRVYKVTILARGRTGGHAMTAAEDDKGMYNLNELYARLVFAMGGRAAEELVFGVPTTGASADIEQATKIARAMVTEYGMSPELGTVKFGDEQGDPFSRMGGGGTLDYSDRVAGKIDDQVHHIIDVAHQHAYRILRDNRQYLDTLAEKLLEKETLRRPDLEVIFEGLDPAPVDDIGLDMTDVRFPRQLGYEPVKTPVEIARERGEEPPKRFSLLEASRKTRAERQAKRDEEKTRQVEQAGSGSWGESWKNQDSAEGQGWRPPNYGGPQPPKDWFVPGSSGSGGPGPTVPKNPYDPAASGGSTPSGQGAGEHPGMKNYAPPVEPADVGETGEREQELIGFRLPEHERPSDDATTEFPRLIDEKPEADPTTKDNPHDR